MNIIISGYGKMGKEIESISIKRGHNILSIFDQPKDWNKLPDFRSDNAVVIDFSQPDVVKTNILKCFNSKIPIVVGTTGWNEAFAEISEICTKGKHALFTASNFSIGVNLFFALNNYLAELMDDHPEYDASMHESHHINKLDKPSGTAITLADGLISHLKRKNKWTLEPNGKEEELAIDVTRKGEIYGDHGIVYESPVDRIEIKHAAKNRKGFAVGAVMAAEWIQGKSGHFEMKDLLGL